MEINMLRKIDNTTEWVELHDEISNEVRLQRQSLTELQMVLKPSLRQAKLELLPLVDQ
jgi:hypothetical protein